MSAATVATPAPKIASKPLLVRRAAVLGAGTMGSRIAAHLANAGIPVLLLDLPPKGSIRASAAVALDALAKSKPAAFFEPSCAALITPGTFDDDLPKLAELRLDHRSRRRKSRNQNRAAHPRPASSRRARAPHHQHLRPAHIANRLRIARPNPGKILRYAFLQSAALHAPPRSDSHRRFRSRSWSPLSPHLPIAFSASRSSLRTTRPTSSPIASASRSCSTPPT